MPSDAQPRPEMEYARELLGRIFQDAGLPAKLRNPDVVTPDFMKDLDAHADKFSLCLSAGGEAQHGLAKIGVLYRNLGLAPGFGSGAKIC